MPLYVLVIIASACCLLPLTSVWGGAPPAPPQIHNPLPVRAATPADAAAGEAARHAKRTACLKEAKSKKLIGDYRNDYIKDCVTR